MNVSKWKTPATYFPWEHVQRYIDQIDNVVYDVAVRSAKDEHGERSKPCPGCGAAPLDLFWFSVTSPEPDWDAGTGKDGFMTICKACQLQVDFLIDDELTAMQEEQWRAIRALA